MMNLIAVICLAALLWFSVAICCDASGSIGNWTEPLPQLRAHSAFYPHPHMRDLKSAAKRGKILVITLVVTTGLVVLVSAAIVRSSKETAEADDAEIIDPAELRASVMAAVAAGRHGLTKGREEALRMALSAYARERKIEWDCLQDLLEIPEHSSSLTCEIGRDRVTVNISDDGHILEIRALCRNVGTSAMADAVEGLVKSSVFTSRVQERGTNT